MDSLSIIVTACDNASTIARTLQSVDEALARFFQEPCSRGVEAEVVIVDDGSKDATHGEIQKVRAERAAWKVVRRHEPSSPSCARNTGVRHSHGQLLFFLDGDDLFLPDHVTACWQALQDGHADFAKTGVKLADPVHPDWKGRIEGSLVINLAIRRKAHDQLGGFPDYLLFRRSAEGLRKEMDLFYKIEDQFYNQLAGRLLKGRLLATETVEYCRHPGNGYDRQYARFCLPFGEWKQPLPQEENLRLRVAEVLVDEWVLQEERRRAQEAGMPASRSLLDAARRSQQAGDLIHAERLCRQVIQQEPADADAWHLLASVLLSQRKGAEAVAAYREALRLRPDASDSHYGLAVALLGQGQRPEAVGHYREALRLRPGHVETTTNLGVLLAEMGRREEAVALLRQAIELRPESAPAHHNLGVALAQLGQPEEGMKQLEEALRLRPDYPEALYNLGNLLKECGRKEEAVERYRQALALKPGYASALNNLGLSLIEMGKPEEAVVYLRQATNLQPPLKEAHMNLGLALAEEGRFEEAEQAYHEALRLDPSYAEAHGNLANCYKEWGRLAAALASYQVALWLDPRSASTRYNRSLALLQKGDHERGWPEYEWRWKRPSMPPRPFRQPRWDGSSLEGRTILIYMEQGLGDMIHFIRYAPLVKAQGGRVVVECPRFMIPLFSTCTGIDLLVAEGEALPDFDVQAPLMSLPGLLRTTGKSVPAALYLHAEPERVEKWRQWLAAIEGFKVGIVWQGNPRHPWDRHRSVPLASFAPLARVPGVRLLSLQKGAGSEQIAERTGHFEVIDLGKDLDTSGGGFSDTAAVMKGLDLVVGVDTAAIHLAGALGVPVWVLLARIADWRWQCEREETPWYPSMRLFRQEHIGQWKTMFERMAAHLQHAAADQAIQPHGSAR